MMGQKWLFYHIRGFLHLYAMTVTFQVYHYSSADRLIKHFNCWSAILTGTDTSSSPTGLHFSWLNLTEITVFLSSLAFSDELHTLRLNKLCWEMFWGFLIPSPSPADSQSPAQTFLCFCQHLWQKVQIPACCWRTSLRLFHSWICVEQRWGAPTRHSAGSATGRDE